MDTSRIIINTIDNSTSLIEESKSVAGFTVVRAPKGPITPVKIPSGGASKIKDIFGVSSNKYPELLEVETFNREYDIWVSAPYVSDAGTEGKTEVPAAYITTHGVFEGKSKVQYSEDVEDVIFGVKDPDSDNVPEFLEEAKDTDVLIDTRYPKSCLTEGEGDFKTEDITDYPGSTPITEGTTTTNYLLINIGLNKGTFDKVFPSNSNCKFIIRDSSDKSEKSYTIEGYKVKDDTSDAGDLGWYNKSTGVFTKYTPEATGHDLDPFYMTIKYDNGKYTSDDSRKNLTSLWIRHFTKDQIKGLIIPKYPSERTMHIDFTAFSDLNGYKKDVLDSRNILKMSVYEDGAFHDSSHQLGVNGSLDPENKKNVPCFNSGNDTYVNQELMYVRTFGKFDDINKLYKGMDKYPSLSLGGGTRKFSTSDIELHNIGWTKALENEYSDVDVFFDSARHDETLSVLTTSSKFFSMCNSTGNSHELAGYIFNFTPVLSSTSTTNLTQLTVGRNYWNICNYAIYPGDGGNICSPMTGARALMQCRIIDRMFGGVAPMWENQDYKGLSMGGQLNMISPYRLKYKYTKSELDKLDAYNYNPVVNDRQYGIMVVGQKTCKSGAITDWSYIGHVCSFLNFLKTVKQNVMIPQIGKPNNPYYRTLRKEQVDQYLSERLTGNNRIWAEGVCDTSTADGVNDVYAQKARKFVINVTVKVDIFSEKVELNFTNEDQATNVSAE